MPDIAPAMPLQPSAPQALTTVAPIASAPTGTDAATPDFLGQLKAALKSLAGVMTVMPAAAVPGQVVVAAAAVSTGNEPSGPAAKTDDQKPVEADLAQVVAALGLVVTPTPVNAEPTISQGAAVASIANATSAPTTPVTAQPLPTGAATAADPQKTAAPDSASASTSTSTAVTVAPAKAETSKSIDMSALTPTTPVQTTHVGKEAIPAAADQSSTPANQVPVAAQQTHQPGTPSVTAPVATAVPTQPVAPQLQGDSGSSHHSGNHGASREDTSTPVVEPTTADHPFTAAAETAATAGSLAAQSTAQPAGVHPGEVVSQIAHQADLYKLPGNKGIRIQLHPEDLGGVQVTMRYAAGGGLELHIAVEHAATGTLVQSGWSELRDALANQGFSPDRLVMSVSAAGNSNQLDFSSNGGNGYRSDANLAAFADGGQSGQKRDGSDADGLRAGTGWTSEDDLAPVTETASRATGVGAPSRIDYRV